MKTNALLDQPYRNPALGLLTAPLEYVLQTRRTDRIYYQKHQRRFGQLRNETTSKMHYSNVLYVAEHTPDLF
jgi:hypothetical protein